MESLAAADVTASIQKNAPDVSQTSLTNWTLAEDKNGPFSSGSAKEVSRILFLLIYKK